MTCVSATEHKTCAVGFKLDATTKLCVTCGDNVGSCTASSITFCSNSSDSAKYNYITAADDACVGHAITNNCLTIEGTTAPYKCASCITNYIMSNGVCKHWSNWVDGGAVAANKSVATITPGTSAAAVTTITC